MGQRQSTHRACSRLLWGGGVRQPVQRAAPPTTRVSPSQRPTGDLRRQAASVIYGNGRPRAPAATAASGAPTGQETLSRRGSLRELNASVGQWVLKEAPAAFRLRGANKYGAHPGDGRRGSSDALERQLKANCLSGALVLFGSAVVILTPLYFSVSHSRGASSFKEHI